MIKHSKLTFGWKLAILITIAGLIPLYAATYFYYLQAKTALHHAGKVRLEAMIHDMNDEVAGFFAIAASELKVLSAFPVFYKWSDGGKYTEVDWIEEQSLALKSLNERLLDRIDEICVIDPSGREISRIVHGKVTPHHELSFEEARNAFFKPSFRMEPGRVYQGKPYLSHDSRRWVIPFATPVVNKSGRKTAILHFEISLNYIKKMLADDMIGGSGLAYLVDSEGNLLASSGGGSAGDILPLDASVDVYGQTLPRLKMAAEGLQDIMARVARGEKVKEPVHFISQGRHYWAIASPMTAVEESENRWFLIAAFPEDEMLAGLQPWRYVGFALATTLFLGLTALLMGRSISRPVKELSLVAEKVASGDMNVALPPQKRTDELGRLSDSFGAMIGAMREMIADMQASSDEMILAQADLERQNQEMTIKQLELTTHRKELKRQNEILSKITAVVSGLIVCVAERHSFDIRYPSLEPVRCWEIMEGCAPACAVYGSEIFACRSNAGGPCCRDKETGAPPSIRQCMECPVYKASHSDELSIIGENFNIMMNILQGKAQELDETKKQLIQSEKMSSVGQLAAGVAHEINNPIGFISSNMTTLTEYAEDIKDLISRYTEIQEKVSRGEYEEAREESSQLQEFRKSRDIDFVLEDLDKLVKESLDGAKRVARIVKNLKEFSHVDEAEWKPSDINEGLESTLSIIWNELKYKATVVKEYGDIPQVECYPMQLNQVFMNLLVNAAQAIPDKGEIRIKTWQEDGFVCIAISDTGAGIPEDVKSKIFNPFFTTKGVGKGTGLGLSIAYGIIEQHKGSIKVDSKEGAGTTFTIKLPLTPKTV